MGCQLMNTLLSGSETEGLPTFACLLTWLFATQSKLTALHKWRKEEGE